MCSLLEPYRTPELLLPLQLLDLLELCGTTTAAARAAELSQPTVSRRTRQLLRELELPPPGPRQPTELSYGENACLHLLRQAAQLHRLEAGASRLSSSPWSQALLETTLPTPLVPAQFRHPRSWQALVRARILDAAVLSGVDLEQLLAQPLKPAQGPMAWDDYIFVPLTAEPLGLLLPDTYIEEGLTRWSVVAVPAPSLAPGLGACTRQRHWHCLYAPRSCQSAHDWAAWLSEQKLPALATPRWCRALQRHLPSWRWWPLSPATCDDHWLLVLQNNWESHPVLPQLAGQWRSAIQQSHAQAESELEPTRGQNSSLP
ncbi:hypothetical protein SynWH8101_1051 [Synechococcus sp. WH 8101]|uniref:hypothetical protein n=1 Tax=Synechococcus sp. WH 8101 TaxID=59932 RepID=UPI0010235E36|nr:hypothetical protein [Synechococcus sp. WH 8101]QBE68639.1 hypothetical protein SynWH8101_1051 [Synechococcus sp. WH 8101]QNI44861.1 hypothetical protein SynRCC2555_01075 [Synechococcus sp. WH 8101]